MRISDARVGVVMGCVPAAEWTISSTASDCTIRVKSAALSKTLDIPFVAAVPRTRESTADQRIAETAL